MPNFPKSMWYEAFCEWQKEYGLFYPFQPWALALLNYCFYFRVISNGVRRAGSEWRMTLGDIIYAKILATPVIILNSIEVAEELCSKRGHIWSGRPRSRMMMDL